MKELEEKKRYLTPLITVYTFIVDDVLCSSPDYGDDENGSGDGWEDWDDEFAKPIT